MMANNYPGLSKIKSKLLSFAFAVLLLSTFSFAEDRIDFVIDLDDVLIYPWDPEHGNTSANKIVEAAGYKWRVADGAEEFIQSLLEIPNARVSFFSGAPAARNTEVLKNIRLPNGKSAFTAAQGRVFSKSDLTTPNGNKRYGKDLMKVALDVNLSRAILFDDQLNYALAGQEKNLLLVNNELAIFLEADQMFRMYRTNMDKGKVEFARSVARDFVIDNNKLARARGMVEAALEESKRFGTPLCEVIYKMQWTVTGKMLKYRPEVRENLDYIRRGVRLFKFVNRDYRFTPLIPAKDTVNCLLRTLQRSIHQLKGKSN